MEEKKSISRSAEVINNLMANRGFENGEAYAYAFGWCWAMLHPADREKILTLSAKTEEQD